MEIWYPVSDLKKERAIMAGNDEEKHLLYAAFRLKQLYSRLGSGHATLEKQHEF